MNTMTKTKITPKDEIILKREESIKHFRLEGNMYRAILYSNPVHYLNNDLWEDIDNSLLAQTLENKSFYVNDKNNFKLSFLETTNKEEHLLNIKDGNYAISLLVEDILDGVIADTYNQSEAFSDDVMNLPKLYSKIQYLNSIKSNDILFDIFSKKVNLKILFNSDDAQIEPLKFSLLFKNLDIIKEEETILFVDKNDDSKKVFELPPCFMQDKNGMQSKCRLRIDSIKMDDNIIIASFTLNPDWNFILNEDVEFPVNFSLSFVSATVNSFWDSTVGSLAPNANYYTNPYLGAGINSSGGVDRFYVKIPTFPTMTSGDMVTSSHYYLTSAWSGYSQINVFEATQDWNQATITWNNRPTYDNIIKDFQIIGDASKLYSWDITQLVKKWYSSGINYGFAVVNNNETRDYSLFYSSDSSVSKSYVTVDYINCTGIYDMWTYHNMSASIAGNVNVHDYTGNACVVVDDVVLSGNLVPINLQHVYNSNDKDVDLGYGLGWRLSYMQTVQKTISTDGTYYIHTDNTGRKHYYTLDQATNSYKQIMNTDYTLTIDSSNLITIVDKSNNRLKFDSQGRLYNVIDSNNNTLTVAYNTDGLIGTITDGANRITRLNYTSKYLTSITKPNSVNINYVYNTAGSKRILTGITYQNDTENQAIYTYNLSNYLLTSAQTITGYAVNLEYNTNMPYRVTKLYENNVKAVPVTTGRSTTITYGTNTNIFTDQLGKKNIYQFNNLGQTISTQNIDSSAYFQKYDETLRNMDKLATSSGMQKSVVNLLSNPSAERVEDWNYAYWGDPNNGSGTYSTDYAYIGNQSLKLTSTTNVANINWYRSIDFTPGKTYTLSAYAKCNALNAGIDPYSDVYLEFVYFIGSTLYNGPLSNKISGDTDWTRLKVTLTVPNNATQVIIRLRMVFTSGNAWFDAIQLEEGYVANHYNLVENNDFTNDLTAFSTNSASIITTQDGLHPSFLSPKCAMITGAYGHDKYIYQYIPAKGAQGDNFSFSGWSRADSVPLRGNEGQYRMILGFKGLDDVYTYERAEFNHDPIDWQFMCVSAIAPYNYKELMIGFEYNNNANTAYLDCIELYKKEMNNTYEYDFNGNLIESTNLEQSSTNYKYSSSNDQVAIIDSKQNEANYTYDANHNLKTSSTATNVQTVNNYDLKGNVIDSTTGTGTYTTLTQYSYDSTGSYTTKITNSRGYYVQNIYNIQTGDLTNFYDAKNYKTTYYYNNSNLHQLSRVENVVNGVTVSVGYKYTDNMLSQVDCNGFTYYLRYDNLHNLSKLLVNNTTLVDYVYDTLSWQLINTKYNNNQTLYYSYDQYYRLSQKHTNEGYTFNYTYDNYGNIAKVEYVDRGLITDTSYDILNRPIEVRRNDLIRFKYKYDDNSNIIENVDNIQNVVKTTKYQYDGSNNPITTELDNGLRTYYTYNSLGMLTNTSSEIQDLNVTIKYLDGINGKKTNLISSYSRCNDSYQYSYDENENITRISYRGKSVKYTYNEIYELTREDNGFINETYVYTYDNGGNIKTRNTYAYTEGTPTTLISTDTFTYDTSWKDKITSFNGINVISDAIGNITSYSGYTLVWMDGRRLKQVNAKGKTISYDYNEDNMRISKTVDGAVTNYYLNGNKIAAIKTGTDTMYFSYDAMGRAISILYNNEYYYYVYNGQNDVVSLMDKNGKLVVTYSYDTWGNLKLTAANILTLAKANPFRYRGYIYDDETGFYYLQNRYYDPKLCRFISPDDITGASRGLDNVLGSNVFAYCMNNPVMGVDYSGEAATHGGGGAFFGGNEQKAISYNWGYKIYLNNATTNGIANFSMGAIAAIDRMRIPLKYATIIKEVLYFINWRIKKSNNKGIGIVFDFSFVTIPLGLGPMAAYVLYTMKSQ